MCNNLIHTGIYIDQGECLEAFPTTIHFLWNVNYLGIIIECMCVITELLPTLITLADGSWTSFYVSIDTGKLHLGGPDVNDVEELESIFII